MTSATAIASPQLLALTKQQERDRSTAAHAGPRSACSAANAITSAAHDDAAGRGRTDPNANRFAGSFTEHTFTHLSRFGHDARKRRYHRRLSALDLSWQQSALSAALSRIDQDHPLKPGEISMDNKHVDQGQGRLKTMAGSLTDDKHRKNEGRRDQAKGSAKNTADKVVDTLPGRGTE